MKLGKLDRKIDDIVDEHYQDSTTCKEMCAQIKQLCFAHERKRILEEIEKITKIRLYDKYKWESDDVFEMLNDIRKILES